MTVISVLVWLSKKTDNCHFMIKIVVFIDRLIYYYIIIILLTFHGSLGANPTWI